MSTATRLFVLLVQPLLVQPLLLPALARTSRQLGARPVGAPALRLAPRSRLVVGLADDDNINGYRELGLAEDATYDEVMDAFMSLSETYSDNPERMMVSPAAPYRSTPWRLLSPATLRRAQTLELAKNKVLDERLKQRMSGSLGGAEASPWDERPVVRRPRARPESSCCARPDCMRPLPAGAHAAVGVRQGVRDAGAPYLRHPDEGARHVVRSAAWRHDHLLSRIPKARPCPRAPALGPASSVAPAPSTPGRARRVVFLGRLLMLVNSGMLIYGRNTDPVRRGRVWGGGKERPASRAAVGAPPFPFAHRARRGGAGAAGRVRAGGRDPTDEEEADGHHDSGAAWPRLPHPHGHRFLPPRPSPCRARRAASLPRLPPPPRRSSSARTLPASASRSAAPCSSASCAAALAAPPCPCP